MKTQKIDIRKFSKMALLRSLPQSAPGALERIAEELIRREMVFRKTIEDALTEIEGDERLGYPTATVVENAPLALVQCGLENQRRALRFALKAIDGQEGELVVGKARIFEVRNPKTGFREDHYFYRDRDGELFTVVCKGMKEAIRLRNEWKKKKRSATNRN